MELYFSPMACSLASRISLYESGQSATFKRVQLSDKAIASGGSLLDISAKGQVPVLVLDDGTVLTEGPAVLQYIADRQPDSGLLPPVGTTDRYQVLSWLNYVGTEIHKLVFWHLFSPDTSPEAKAFARSKLPAKLAHLDQHLAGRRFLAGDRFTVADAYLAWALALVRRIGVDLAGWPNVATYAGNIHSRPAVARAMSDEAAMM